MNMDYQVVGRLVYQNRVLGYRFKRGFSVFDLEADALKKHGFQDHMGAQVRTLPLAPYGGTLCTEEEFRQGKLVDNRSADRFTLIDVIRNLQLQGNIPIPSDPVTAGHVKTLIASRGKQVRIKGFGVVVIQGVTEHRGEYSVKVYSSREDEEFYLPLDQFFSNEKPTKSRKAVR